MASSIKSTRESQKWLAEIATGREQSFFAADLHKFRHEVTAAVRGKKILVIGGAGSIGSNTIFTLCRYSPSAMHVIDQNENELAELVRRFRSSDLSDCLLDLRMLPLDYGAAAMRLFLATEGPYDVILNFAAVKHVRSEKDTYSIIQMLDTNVVKQARLMGWIAKHSPKARYFSVSTDKAANPSSFMGATKRIMEHVMFSEVFRLGFEGSVTSARFANVAFSNGSLLQSFENRLARKEPLACPVDIRRFFVSLEESGHICTLACFLIDTDHIAVPRLNPENSLVALTDVAERFLREKGFEPSFFTDEREAKQKINSEIRRKRWPLILTNGDTAGEKPFEEFVAVGETVIEANFESILTVPYLRPSTGGLKEMVMELEEIVLGRRGGTVIPKEALKAIVGKVEPAFLATHQESSLNLDQRM